MDQGFLKKLGNYLEVPAVKRRKTFPTWNPQNQQSCCLKEKATFHEEIPGSAYRDALSKLICDTHREPGC